VILVGFKPNLDNQPVFFSALTLLVCLVIWPVNIVPEMTYEWDAKPLHYYHYPFPTS